MVNSPASLAVLIDAENAQPTKLSALLAEIAKYGVASVKRAYGDFTNPSLGGWKSRLLEHSIQLIQQFNNITGKNASDIALVIDAMGLLHSKRFDGFCLVSSDSDFTRLASRLREEGLVVYGFGEKKTPTAFVVACDKFIYTEILGRQPSQNAGRSATPLSDRKEVPIDILRSAVESSADDAGWAHLGRVGQVINNQLPDFDCRNYGHKTFLSLLQATGAFEQERRGPKGSGQSVFVRVKPDL